jgi:ParB family chromosome partitioning protein
MVLSIPSYGPAHKISDSPVDLASYEGDIVSDPFGNENYFADMSVFWIAHSAATEARAEEYHGAGWKVVVLPTGEAFHSWAYERAPKRSRVSDEALLIW